MLDKKFVSEKTVREWHANLLVPEYDKTNLASHLERSSEPNRSATGSAGNEMENHSDRWTHRID